MFTMIQKCSLGKVFEVFVDEPLKIHYIKEISRKIKLAPTSVKKHLKDLDKQELIVRKKGERFLGFIANRDNDNFIFYKKIFNLIKLKECHLLDYLIKTLYPQTIILYGSYLSGEDVEKSDIDLMIISKTKKRFNIEKFEKKLNRKIHIITEPKLNKLPKELKSEIINGLVLYGYLKNE